MPNLWPQHALRRAALLGGVALLALGAATARAGENAYVQTNLVADQPGVALVTDPNLVNPWGLSASPTSPIWVADNATSVSTLYRGANGSEPITIVPLVVSIAGGGAPTGTVFNGTGQFVVSDGTSSASALFLFASETGAITGWAPTVGTGGKPPPSTATEVAVTVPGAEYKGLSLGVTARGPRLYAANFTQNRVDVWDGNFMPAAAPGAFTDPNLPDGYAPFNVQVIGNRLFVAYAQQSEDEPGEEEAGPGRGVVDVYTLQGRLLKRLISHDHLNAPWGLVQAPPSFGAFGNALLVGNFGNGRIHAYDIHTGEFLGTLQDAHGNALDIDGLWALRVGNGTIGTKHTLLFSAGPDEETHGLFGSITPAS